MRPFSNIMPNFAANLHLLVDSIHIIKQNNQKNKKKSCFHKNLFNPLNSD